MSTLKQLVDETTNIKNELVTCHTDLGTILAKKGIEVLPTDKIPKLISKVDSELVKKQEDNKLWLIRDGKKIVDFVFNEQGSGTKTYEWRSDCLYVYINNNSVAGAGYYISTTNPIDLSKYSKLKTKVKKIGNGYIHRLRVDSNLAYTQFGGLTDNVTHTVETDVSGINRTDKSVGFGFFCSSNQSGNTTTQTNYIYDLWLEK